MSAVQLALVANPKSGSGSSPDEVAAALRDHGHDVATFALDAASDVAASDAERVVVAGGDGSIGCVFAACADARKPLAVVPSGTANDFARALGVPAEIDEAVAVAADPDASALRVWGATLDGHPFVNVASIGLAVDAAEQAAPMKSMLGPVAYALGALRSALSGSPVPARVTVDGEVVFSGDAWQVLLAATGAFGGIAQLPDTDPETPPLEVYVLEAGSRLGLARQVWGMRRGGRRERVVTGRGRQVSVTVGPRCRWNVDGEILTLGDVDASPLGPVSVLVPHDADGSATR